MDVVKELEARSYTDVEVEGDMKKRVRASYLPITEDGLDWNRVSLEYNYRTVVGPDRERAMMSIRVLGTAADCGRVDAAVFLFGLLVDLPTDDWEMRIAVVEALRRTRTEQCARLLCSEIRRVRSSNTTRRYIDSILKVLGSFPKELVERELGSLATDTSFSPKMRRKFEENLFSVRFRSLSASADQFGEDAPLGE